MFIILLVTAKTGGRRVVELVGGSMALFANHFFMLADQGETSHSMVKMSILPALLDMTRLTGSAQVFLVRIILEMAIGTLGGRCFEIYQQVRPTVAFGAGQFNMHANRGKGCLAVFKMLIDTFFAIMAGATIGRVFTEMGNHKSSVKLDMAVNAFAGFKNFVTIDMTVLTDKGRAFRICLVRGCGKTDQFVWKIVQGYVGQWSFCAAVFRMTLATGQHCLMVKQNTVEFMGIGKFELDVSMAAHTAVLHGIGIPGSRVTLFAIPYLSMRTDISKQRSRLCI